MLLAESLGLDAIASAAAKLVKKNSTNPATSMLANSEHFKFFVPILEACERHPAEDSVWTWLRRRIVTVLNRCKCSSCRENSAGPYFPCPLQECNIQELSRAALVTLIGMLPSERPHNAAFEDFEWMVPAGEVGRIVQCPVMTTKTGFSFHFRVIPKRGDRHAQVELCARQPAPQRIKFKVPCQPPCYQNLSASEPNAQTSAYSGCSRSYRPRYTSDGSLWGTASVCHAKSTKRRDTLLRWAHGNGLKSTQTSALQLLHFFSSRHSLDQVVADALLCHVAPNFVSLAATDEFVQLPVAAMQPLLARDDLDVTSESQVVELLEPWAQVHMAAELQQLTGSLRLAWIPPQELRALLTDGILQPVVQNPAVKVMVEEALEAQACKGRKRAHEDHASVPDGFVCAITQDIMKDPVVASDGHSYERSAISRWLENHNTSPKTNLPVRTRELIPNLDLKRAIQQHRERQCVAGQRLQKRAKFHLQELPTASRLDQLLSNAN